MQFFLWHPDEGGEFPSVLISNRPTKGKLQQGPKVSEVERSVLRFGYFFFSETTRLRLRCWRFIQIQYMQSVSTLQLILIHGKFFVWQVRSKYTYLAEWEREFSVEVKLFRLEFRLNRFTVLDEKFCYAWTSWQEILSAYSILSPAEGLIHACIKPHLGAAQKRLHNSSSYVKFRSDNNRGLCFPGREGPVVPRK